MRRFTLPRCSLPPFEINFHFGAILRENTPLHFKSVLFLTGLSAVLAVLPLFLEGVLAARRQKLVVAAENGKQAGRFCDYQVLLLFAERNSLKS